MAATEADADLVTLQIFSGHIFSEDANISQLTEDFRGLLRTQRNSIIRESVRLLFHLRDIRAGAGKRALFLGLFEVLNAELPDIALNLLQFIPLYGCWRDIFQLAEASPGLQSAALQLAARQLRQDEAVFAETRDIRRLSFAAKWAPREGKRQHDLAVKFAKVLFGFEGIGYRTLMSVYRKRLATLNHAIRTVEILECAGRWGEIRSEQVHKRAREIKATAYLRHGVPLRPFSSEYTRGIDMQNRYSGVLHMVDQWLNGGWRGL